VREREKYGEKVMKAEKEGEMGESEKDREINGEKVKRTELEKWRKSEQDRERQKWRKSEKGQREREKERQMERL
jgi:hypothetical protein